MSELKVSVVMITYGHEKFIEQALNGVFSQKCNFNIEVIIANDNSPDNTDQYIRKFLKNNFEENFSVNYIKRDKNCGMMTNFIEALSKASGKYIAICEGDDYWTDPLKLQKQVAILENDSSLSISFHNVNVKNEFGGSDKDFYEVLKRSKPAQITTLEKILEGNYIPTLSVVFKNNNVKFDNNYDNFTVGDWPLHVLNANYGNLHFLDEKMAVYRIHDGGVHQNGHNWTFKRRLKELKSEMLILRMLKKQLPAKYKDKINKKIIIIYKHIIRSTAKNYFDIILKKWK